MTFFYFKNNIKKLYSATIRGVRVLFAQKITKRFLLSILTLLVLIPLYLIFIGIGYKTIDYSNDKDAKKAFYAYDLNGIRLLFSGERKIGTDIPGMKALHINNFWEEEGCANMIPSIFSDSAFFVDKKIKIKNKGNTTKKTFIYEFTFSSSKLHELVPPFAVDRVYKKNNTFFAASVVNKRLVLLYEIDKDHKKFKLADFYIIPSGYRFVPRTNFLEVCNFDIHDCREKKEYVGFGEEKKLDEMYHDEQQHYFSYKGEKLIIKNDYKNLFLGY